MANRNQLFSKYYSTHLGAFNSQPNPINTEYFEDALGQILPPAGSSKKILEIGVGGGHFAFFAVNSKKFQNYFGIDISQECIEIVRATITPNIQLVSNTVDWLKSAAGQFDYIVLLDVVEHIPKAEQYEFLESIRSALSREGVAIIRTENTAIYSGYLQHTLDYTHEYNFSEKSLEQLLKLTGFSKIHLFGDPAPRQTGVKSFLRLILTKLWRFIQNVILEIERPHCLKPKILTKNIYAVVTNGPQSA